MGDVVFLSTKNLSLPGIHKLQPWSMESFKIISIEPGFYCLDLLPSIATVHPWFYTSFFKPVGPQTAGSPVLEYDSCIAKAIL